MLYNIKFHLGVDPAKEVEVLELDEVDTDSEKERNLVVFNDDVNTFDHVIQALIDICDHTKEQAEQCTLIIHYKGKCVVKNGSYEKLAPMCTAICDRGISAEVA
ncbi:MAG: Clp protease ClpS [Thalassobius sp.]|nr:Clp protease ClpS [Thalassovita sp.]